MWTPIVLLICGIIGWKWLAGGDRAEGVASRRATAEVSAQVEGEPMELPAELRGTTTEREAMGPRLEILFVDSMSGATVPSARVSFVDETPMPGAQLASDGEGRLLVNSAQTSAPWEFLQVTHPRYCMSRVDRGTVEGAKASGVLLLELVPSGEVLVRVVGGRSQPAEGVGARLRLVDGEDPCPTHVVRSWAMPRKTGSDGSLRYQGVPVGYLMQVEIPDEKQVEACSFRLDEGARQAHVECQVERLGQIVGRVLDSAGNGAAYVPVNRTMQGGDLDYARTDSDGRYHFYKAAPGRYSLTVPARAKKAVHVDVSATGLVTAPDIELVEDVALTGQVVLGDAAACSNLTNIWIHALRLDGREVAQELIPPTGEFTLRVRPGAYRLVLRSSAGELTGDDSSVEVLAPASNIHLSAERAAGAIRLGDAASVGVGRLMMTPLTDGSAASSDRSDWFEPWYCEDGGAKVIPGVQPGTYAVWGRVDDQRAFWVPSVRVEPGAIAEVEVGGVQTGVLEIRPPSGGVGAPAVGSNVLVLVSHQGKERVLECAPNGGSLTVDLAPGPYGLGWLSPTTRYAELQPVSILAGDTTLVQLNPRPRSGRASVQLRVRVIQGGEAAIGKTVSLHGLPTEGLTSTAANYFSQTTDAVGEVLFGVESLGRYRADVAHEGGMSWKVVDVLGRGEHHVDVRLPGPAFDVRVVDRGVSMGGRVLAIETWVDGSIVQSWSEPDFKTWLGDQSNDQLFVVWLAVDGGGPDQWYPYFTRKTTVDVAEGRIELDISGSEVARAPEELTASQGLRGQVTQVADADVSRIRFNLDSRPSTDGADVFHGLVPGISCAFFSREGLELGTWLYSGEGEWRRR